MAKIRQKNATITATCGAAALVLVAGCSGSQSTDEGTLGSTSFGAPTVYRTQPVENTDHLTQAQIQQQQLEDQRQQIQQLKAQ